MKKHISRISIILLFIFFIVGLSSCETDDEGFKDNTKLYRTELRTDAPLVITDELELGFNFFWELANTTVGSPAFGLIPDRYQIAQDRGGSVASIASNGFGLSTIPIGIEAGWITREEGEERAYQTLLTYANSLERTRGFWYHFLSMSTGLRMWESEVSIIDSAILINGALTVGRYFGGRTEQLAYQMYEEMEWNWYFDHQANKFYMGYKPESGFEGYWNGYAEQLMIHILAAGSPKYSIGKGAYQLMKYNSRLVGPTTEYGVFYPTWTGSLFTHQYSHAWFDFAAYNDETGFNWFTNSVNAVDAAIAYAKTQTSRYSGINENSWGMSATDGPSGYVGPYGSGPSQGGAHVVDGTVPAYGALGSIVFRPEKAIAAAENYRSFDKFWTKYGFTGSYNLSHQTGGWFAPDIIGIDKGISVLMIENYMSGMIWKIYMEVPYIQEAIDVLDFVAV